MHNPQAYNSYTTGKAFRDKPVSGLWDGAAWELLVLYFHHLIRNKRDW